MKRNQFYKILLTGWLGILLVGYATTVFGQYQKIDAQLQKNKGKKALVDIFKEMPKGGDIHTHLVGAVPMLCYWNWAKAGAWKVNGIGEITPGIRNGFVDSISVLKKWSILEYTEKNQRGKANHFFNSFILFDPLSNAYTKELLQELKKLAVENNVQYLEIMAVSPKIDTNLFEKYTDYKNKLDRPGDVSFEATLNELIKEPGFYSFIGRATDKYIKDIRNLENSASNEGVICRYQGYSNRNNADLLKVFSQLYISVLACKNPSDSLLVGVNIVNEESGKVSLKNYMKHMLMFKVLKQHYPNVKFSLHAGEMVPLILETADENLCYNHIKNAVEIAGANRIGHGVDINQRLNEKCFEDNKDVLLARMKRDTVVVEINLTSNDFILGVNGANHCIRTYMDNQVPCVISTDDQGILCTDWANEYAKLYNEHVFSYIQIKQLILNSIKYSFASPGMKAKLEVKLNERFKKFEDKWNQ